MDLTEIKHFIEAALLAAGRPMTIDQIHGLFDDSAAPEKAQLREAIAALKEEYRDRGIEIKDVASGFRIQIRSGMADRLHKLWEDRPPRYSRALFETLALIAYRQPMTRGEIEEVRGVSVSSNIVRSLLEREWIRVVGHRDVPGRPALFGTTKLFLDYFGLKKLEDLPPLADLSDWETLRVQLNLPEVEVNAVAVESADITELKVPQNDAQLSDEDDSTPAAPSGSEESDSEESILTESDLPVLDVEGVATSDKDDTDESTDSVDVGFEEIVATEWPDPAAAVEPPADAVGTGDSDDVEKTASGS